MLWINAHIVNIITSIEPILDRMLRLVQMKPIMATSCITNMAFETIPVAIKKLWKTSSLPYWNIIPTILLIVESRSSMEKLLPAMVKKIFAGRLVSRNIIIKPMMNPIAIKMFRNTDKGLSIKLTWKILIIVFRSDNNRLARMNHTGL